MKLFTTPVAVLALPLAGAAPAQATGHSDRAVLHRYAADTWRAMVAMVDPATALPADNIMIMGALGNHLRGDLIRRAFVTPQIERTLKPLLCMEKFNVPAHQEVS